MKVRIIAGFLLISQIGCKSQDTVYPENFALTGSTIIPMDAKKRLTDKTILVSKGKIVDIINNTEKIPAQYNVVNIHGKYVMPGLIDMHIHLRSLDEFNSYLYYGITSVLHMSGPTSGAKDLEGYRDLLKADKMKGPNLFFTSFNVEGKEMNYPGVSVSLTTEQQVVDFVSKTKKRKCDFIKVYETIDSLLYKILLSEAKKSGIYVIGHTPRNINPITVLKSGQIMVAHCEEFFFDFFDCRNCGKEKKPDESKITQLISILKEQKMVVTPNLSFVHATKGALSNVDSIWQDEEVKYLPPNIYQTWQNSNPNKRENLEEFKEREAVKYPFLQKLTKQLYESGIPLITGSDASLIGLPPGKSLIQEIFELNKAGIDNYGCLEAATRNPGEFLKNYSAAARGILIGQVKKGYVADLLVLSNDPLENLQNLNTIEFVISRGKILTRQEIKSERKVFR